MILIISFKNEQYTSMTNFIHSWMYSKYQIIYRIQLFCFRPKETCTYSQVWQCQFFFDPVGNRLGKLIRSCGGDHHFEGLKERLDHKAELFHIRKTQDKNYTYQQISSLSYIYVMHVI